MRWLSTGLATQIALTSMLVTSVAAPAAGSSLEDRALGAIVHACRYVMIERTGLNPGSRGGPPGMSPQASLESLLALCASNGRGSKPRYDVS